MPHARNPEHRIQRTATGAATLPLRWRRNAKPTERFFSVGFCVAIVNVEKYTAVTKRSIFSAPVYFIPLWGASSFPAGAFFHAGLHRHTHKTLR